MTARWRRPETWECIAATQDGVVARRQLLASGWSADDVETAVRSGRWRALGRGVYAVHRGPLPPRARAWVAVLQCGDGAGLAGLSALHAWGVVEEPAVIHVGYPAARRVRHVARACLHRSSAFPATLHTGPLPRRQWVEEALLTACDELDDASAVAGLALHVLGSRSTTSDRVRRALAARRRSRWRPLLAALACESDAGSRSLLEHEYRSRVHRAHRLPAAEFNAADRDDAGRRCYRDVRYAGLVVVELDGERYHGLGGQRRDRDRDNVVAAVRSCVTLRFGWVEVTQDPCRVAALVAAALRARGWDGVPAPCAVRCHVREDLGRLTADSAVS